MTQKEATTRIAALGWTLRRVDGELVVYPKGTSVEHPAAYWPDSLDDALGTVRAETRRASATSTL